MADESGQELPSEKPFRITNYRDGFYQPNGTFSPEPLLSEQAIEQWEKDNRRGSRGKAWGAGQALFFKNPVKPLLFGRNSEVVDVRIDGDPDRHGFVMWELGVSRRHFQLHPPKDGKILIHDVGSTNGVEIFQKDRSARIRIDSENPDAELSTGDYALFGNGNGEREIHLPDGNVVANPKEWQRYVGFRVCQTPRGELYLVKFNVMNIEEGLNLSGKSINDLPEERREGFATRASELVGLPAGIDIHNTIDSESTEKIYTRRAFDLIYHSMENYVSETDKNRNSREALNALDDLLHTIINQSRSLGEKFYSGDWTLGAVRIAKYALDQGENAQQSKDLHRVAIVTRIASATVQIANHKLFN